MTASPNMIGWTVLLFAAGILLVRLVYRHGAQRRTRGDGGGNGGNGAFSAMATAATPTMMAAPTPTMTAATAAAMVVAAMAAETAVGGTVAAAGISAALPSWQLVKTFAKTL